MINAQEIIESKVFNDTFVSLETDLWADFKKAAEVQGNQAELLQSIAVRSWALGQVRAELERRMTKSVETHINRKQV